MTVYGFLHGLTSPTKCNSNLLQAVARSLWKQTNMAGVFMRELSIMAMGAAGMLRD